MTTTAPPDHDSPDQDGRGGTSVAIDPAALSASIQRLERVAHDRDGSGPADPVALVELVVGAADSLFALSGVGLMFVDSDDALRYVAASDDAIRALERVQEELGEGPCLDSLVLDATVRSPDLTTDERYRAVGAIVGPLGVRAVLGVPVRVAGAPVATLNVYRDRPHDWPEDEVDALSAYARLLGSLLGTLVAARRSDSLAAQLRYALEHRIVVERAIGYLMADRGVDAVAAFDLLRRAARHDRRKVREVAADVLGGGADVLADARRPTRPAR